MRLRRLAKLNTSGTNGCPAVYDELDGILPGYLVIQGDLAGPEIMAQLENLLPGETAVVIKREIVLEALRKLLAESATP